jgi:hypothetical protein
MSAVDAVYVKAAAASPLFDKAKLEDVSVRRLRKVGVYNAQSEEQCCRLLATLSTR